MKFRTEKDLLLEILEYGPLYANGTKIYNENYTFFYKDGSTILPFINVDMTSLLSATWEHTPPLSKGDVVIAWNDKQKARRVIGLFHSDFNLCDAAGKSKGQSYDNIEKIPHPIPQWLKLT